MGIHTEKPVPMHVGIIGTGMISGIYLKTMIERMDILQVDAIAGRNMEKTRAAAEKYGLRACTTDEILADPSIDIVLVLTGPATHEEIISKALNAGKHVYTEKSFALETEAGKRLCSLAREKGLYLGCAPDTFFAGWVQKAREVIDSGMLGTISSFAMVGNRDNERMLSAHDYLNRPGGGIIQDYAVYYLTVLTSLLGPVVRVSARIKAPYPTHVNIFEHSPHFGEVIETPNESQIYSMLEMENGVTGTLSINADSAFFDQTYFAVYGNRGILYLGCPDWFEGEVWFYDNNLDFEKHILPKKVQLEVPYAFRENSRGVGVAEMAWAIREGREHRASGERALHVLDIEEKMVISNAHNSAFEDVETTCTRPLPLQVPAGNEESAFRITP